MLCSSVESNKMPALLLTGLAKCSLYDRKIERIATSTILFEVVKRNPCPGLFYYRVTNFDTIAPVEILCDQRGMISRCSFMVTDHKVRKAPAEIAIMYSQTGKLGHPVVSLQDWPPNNGEPSFLDSHLRATPYILGRSLLVCFGDERRAPAQWLVVSSDLHMGFDKCGHLTCLRFPGLTTWQILRLRWSSPL